MFQETFRAVSLHLAKFAPRRAVGSFRSWLRTIVRNKIDDHFRRLEKEPSGRGGTEAQLRLAELADPFARKEGDDGESDEADHEFLVARAMEIVKPHFSSQNWNAFWQVAVEGKPATEVAEGLDVNPQAVRQSDHRIRRRLRAVLEDVFDDS